MNNLDRVSFYLKEHINNQNSIDIIFNIVELLLYEFPNMDQFNAQLMTDSQFNVLQLRWEKDNHILNIDIYDNYVVEFFYKKYGTREVKYDELDLNNNKLEDISKEVKKYIEIFRKK